MRALLRTLRRVGSDLLNFRNVDAYIVTAVGLALVVIELLGDVAMELQLTIILMALVVLVFRATTPVDKPGDINSILHDRRDFGPFREFVRGAQQVWIYAPSASNILADASPLKQEVLDKGGRIHILLQDPNLPVVIENLQQQLDIAALDLRKDINNSVSILERLKTRTTGTLEYGFLPYSPGFSLIIIDPQRASGRLIVEFFGFANEFIANRMHIRIDQRESEYWFAYWVEQFEEMRKAALAHQSRHLDV